MSRLERPQGKNTNPATKFLEWKSDEKCFSFYDKETKQNVLVDLPLKVAFIEHYHTVKGWHDATQSGIYSNEVYGIGYEHLTVKTFKGLEISKGLYKENKDKINNAGGNYYRSIYCSLDDGSIINIALKGACIGGIKKEKAVDSKEHPGYSEFSNNNSNALEYQWLEINSFAEAKSGKINYSIPVFSLGEKITAKEDSLINQAAKNLQEFVKSRKETATTGATTVKEEVSDDDFL
jgi:hypothetical protein